MDSYSIGILGEIEKLSPISSRIRGISIEDNVLKIRFRKFEYTQDFQFWIFSLKNENSNGDEVIEIGQHCKGENDEKIEDKS